MRIRKPFAGAFAAICLLAAFAGFSPSTAIPQYGQSDKALHFVAFFLITLSFYWILETSRRRAIHVTLLVCTAGLSIASELVQAVLPNDRQFDPFDILANVLGSGAALGLCSAYHRRMLERKRAAKTYNLVPGEEDVELGETTHDAEQEEGVARPTLTEELDNWDENAEDWEEDEAPAAKPDAPEGNGTIKKNKD